MKISDDEIIGESYPEPLNQDQIVEKVGFDPEHPGPYGGGANAISDTLFVKYGFTVHMHEAHAQLMAYNHGVKVPKLYHAFVRIDVTYILMENIHGRTVSEHLDIATTDLEKEKFAKMAIQSLCRMLTIPRPEALGERLATVNGEPLSHPFFKEQDAPLVYDSPEHLAAHINRLLIRIAERDRSDHTLEVDFTREKVVFVYSDINSTNFIVTPGGEDLYVVDFGHAGFLPESFMAFAIHSFIPNYAAGLARAIKSLINRSVRPESAGVEELPHFLEGGKALLQHPFSVNLAALNRACNAMITIGETFINELAVLTRTEKGNASNHFPITDEILGESYPAPLTQAQIVAHAERHRLSFKVHGRGTVALSQTLFLKYGRGDSLSMNEAYALLLAYNHGVRVPKLYHAFRGQIDTTICTFILMERIHGQTVNEYLRQAEKNFTIHDHVAKMAISTLCRMLAIPMPETLRRRPTPIIDSENDILYHPFFNYNGHMANVSYQSVGDLDRHINKVLERRAEWNHQVNQLEVNFEAEKLVFVYSDLNAKNFLITPEGELYVVDFGYSAFLPESFMAYVVHHYSPNHSENLWDAMRYMLDRTAKEFANGSRTELPEFMEGGEALLYGPHQANLNAMTHAACAHAMMQMRESYVAMLYKESLPRDS